MARCKNCGKVLVASNYSLFAMMTDICKECSSNMGVIDYLMISDQNRSETRRREELERRDESTRKYIESLEDRLVERNYEEDYEEDEEDAPLPKMSAEDLDYYKMKTMMDFNLKAGRLAINIK